MRLILLLLSFATALALPPVEHVSMSELVRENGAWIRRGDQFEAKWCGYTGSMRPYIMGGETVLLEKRTWRTPIYVHDFVVFDRGDEPLAGHEVIDVRLGWLLIKGLNNAEPDGWFPASKVSHIVRRVLRVDTNTLS